ncbi:MAG TPA: histidine phosphatase family protein, partial [Acidimicrobiales bacterium]|nr:histidine phosphatase family protein [Acidimicrobiales bacterium]
MSSTLVLFVRHGRTPTTGTTLPGRAPGLHLSAEGLRQADAVATGLAG